jgi:hypothetical protein
MSDHAQIWLSPRCGKCEGEERTWCQGNVWLEGCEPGMCSAKPTEYVRADLVATPAEVDALRAERGRALVDWHTLRAEVARLREALEAAREMSQPWPPRGGQTPARNPTARNWRDALDSIHDATNAALSQPEHNGMPGHE